eukprot:7127783-Pyramimonas_sp.AAC.1
MGKSSCVLQQRQGIPHSLCRRGLPFCMARPRAAGTPAHGRNLQGLKTRAQSLRTWRVVISQVEPPQRCSSQPRCCKTQEVEWGSRDW